MLADKTEMEADASIETNSARWQGILSSVPRSEDFSLSYSVQTGSGAYPVDIRSYYERRKAVEVWLWHPIIRMLIIHRSIYPLSHYIYMVIPPLTLF